MVQTKECCNHDCNQGRTCQQRKSNAAPAIALAADRAGTVYVSGPMTGLPDLNFPAFNAAADALRKQGYKVTNPADHGVVPGAEWEDYLRKDVADLSACEAIHLLPGWSQSKGARLELHLAKALGLRVMYADGAEHLRDSAEQQVVQSAEITLNGWQLLAALRHANPSLSFNAEEMESEIVISTRPLIDPMNNAKLCDGPIAWVDGVDESAIPLEDSEENSAYGQIPTTQGLDALKALGWAATINGAHFIRFGDWLPDDDCYDHGTLVKLFALPVSEEEAQAERDAAKAKQEAAA